MNCCLHPRSVHSDIDGPAPNPVLNLKVTAFLKSNISKTVHLRTFSYYRTLIGTIHILQNGTTFDDLE